MPKTSQVIPGERRHVFQGRSIPQHSAEIGHNAGGLRPERRWRQARDRRKRDHRADRAGDEHGAPPEHGIGHACEKEGARAAERITGRVDRNRASLTGPIDIPAEQCEPGHMHAGESDAAQEPECDCHPEAICPHGKSESCSCTQDRRSGKDPVAVDAVGPARQKGHGKRITREIDPADPPGLGGTQRPGIRHLRQHGGKTHERREACHQT
jgi:hypothetical protein